MTQLSVMQLAHLVDAVDPFLHIMLLGGILLVLLEAAILLGDVLGSRNQNSPG